MGADDYISKPFDVLELISRVNARSRRYLRKKDETITIKNVKFNLKNREVKVNDEIVKFTNSEFCILKYLVKNKGEIVSRESLFSVIWGKQASFETRILDVHIKEIRKKLGKANSDIIETIYGVVYRLKYE